MRRWNTMSTDENGLIREGLKTRIKDLHHSVEEKAFALADADGIDDQDYIELADRREVSSEEIWKEVSEGNMKTLEELQHIHETAPQPIEENNLSESVSYLDDHYEEVVKLARTKGVDLEECGERIMSGEWQLDEVVKNPFAPPLKDGKGPGDLKPIQSKGALNNARRRIWEILNDPLDVLTEEAKQKLRKVADILGGMETYRDDVGSVKEYEEAKGYLRGLLASSVNADETRLLEEMIETLNS
jgi:hypothetical protein